MDYGFGYDEVLSPAVFNPNIKSSPTELRRSLSSLSKGLLTVPHSTRKSSDTSRAATLQAKRLERRAQSLERRTERLEHRAARLQHRCEELERRAHGRHAAA